MAAITKRLLHLRPTLFHSYSHPLRHFSSSSDRDDAPQPEQSQKCSSLNDVKSSLQNRPPKERHQPPSRAGSTDEIRHRLAEFRDRSAPPPPPGEKYVSLGDLYEKGLKSKGESSDAPSSVGAAGGKQSFDFLRHSLHKVEGGGAANSGRKSVDSLSLSLLMKDLKMKADPNGKLAAGSGGLTQPFFQKGNTGSAGIGKKHEFSELGKKLKAMRPEKPKGKWFSLQEMSDRLAKVRKAEKEERERIPGLHGMHAVTGSLRKLESLQLEKQKLHQVTVGVLGSMGAALEEKIAGPPKDHLIENYFHPDNMSSAEKLKLELNKVRDEFKMSESDCGSARVQVAQLTTRIKHLSSVLHKKDKHSTRGLLAMVQRRKKLLKYLRRTDWDSYCLVLSKLGLRDNADVKA